MVKVSYKLKVGGNLASMEVESLGFQWALEE
jgi:hypothetical protein